MASLKSFVEQVLRPMIGDGWTDTSIFVRASGMTPRATNGPAIGTFETTTHDRNYDVLDFDSSTEEYADFQERLPQQWDVLPGDMRAVFQFRAYWTNASGASAADTVEFEMAAGSLSNDDALDTAPGTGQVISDALTAPGDLCISGWSPEITIAGSPAPGDLLDLTISRNVSGTDDMAEDARLIGVEIQFTVARGVV